MRSVRSVRSPSDDNTGDDQCTNPINTITLRSAGKKTIQGKYHLYVMRSSKSIDMREPQKVTFMRIADGSFMTSDSLDVEVSEGVYQVSRSKIKPVVRCLKCTFKH